MAQIGFCFTGIEFCMAAHRLHCLSRTSMMDVVDDDDDVLGWLLVVFLGVRHQPILWKGLTQHTSQTQVIHAQLQ